MLAVGQAKRNNCYLQGIGKPRLWGLNPCCVPLGTSLAPDSPGVALAGFLIGPTQKGLQWHMPSPPVTQYHSKEGTCVTCFLLLSQDVLCVCFV